MSKPLRPKLTTRYVLVRMPLDTYRPKIYKLWLVDLDFILDFGETQWTTPWAIGSKRADVR